MKNPLKQRPDWAIDPILTGLLGADIRVAARAFAPARSPSETPRLTPVGDLFLTDNSLPAGSPVYFEGRLERYERRIGVVFVRLEVPTSPESGAEGCVFFRGRTAVLLRGPAVVELAFPFQVERLPAEPENYWRDLRVPCVQFEFPVAVEPSAPTTRLLCVPSPVDLYATARTPVWVRDSSERRLPPVDSPGPSAIDQSYGGNTVRGDDASRSQDKTKPRFTT